LLYLLRWYWWRINAWAEIAAMVSSFVLALALFVAQRRGAVMASHVTLLTTIAITTAVWMTVAFATGPTDARTLRRFYSIARPAGPGWRRVRAECPDVISPDELSSAFVGCFAAIALVYGGLFGAGLALLGRPIAALVAAAFAAIGGLVLIRVLPGLWQESPVHPATNIR
jgi:hypothetical protein